MSKVKLKIVSPHEVLEVSPNATPDEIKKAYRKMCLKHHPDKVSDEEKAEATQRFHKIVEAYEILIHIKTESHVDTQTFVVEVTGKVVYVNPKNRKIFHIFTANSEKRYKCIYEGFLPVHVGDAIIGISKMEPNKDTLFFENAPFVMQGSDPDTVLEFINNALRGSGEAGKKFNVKKGQQILDILFDRAGDIESIVIMLDKLSVFLNYSNKEDISDLNIGDKNPHLPFSRIINMQQFHKLMFKWYKQRVLRNLYLLGLTNKEIHSARMNPLKIYRKLLENPYLITSIKLEKCDDILTRCGKHVDEKIREAGKIVRKISELMENNGWTAVPSRVILRLFPNFKDFIPVLKDEFGIEGEMHCIYLSYAHDVEVSISEWVRDLLKSPPIYVSGAISYTRNDLAEEQKMAVETAMNNNISIITGPGGCGKTQTIKELVHNLKNNGISYRIASFTGKAVARIREVVGEKEPMTLNMMIAMCKSTDNKKDAWKHLIIDEASMVTTELMFEFRRRFKHSFKITLVGDKNQLQPISWGTFFENLIKTKKIPTTVLKKIHRTGDYSENGILINSKRIVECKDPEYNGPAFEFTLTSNFKIIPGDLETVKSLIEILMNKGVESSKIVIISPYNKDLDVLNETSSNLYNGLNRSVLDARGRKWRIGDRVIHTQNNYELNLMNGTEGIIVDLDTNYVEVSYGSGTELSRYRYFTLAINEEEDEDDKELNTKNLILSFACSVHRLQGSEAEYVIGYIPQGNPSSTFLNSNLLYTLITRSKKIIWLIGDTETMERAATTSPSWRCENLTQRIISE